MTPEQIELARHALGLPNDRNRSYRNRYFVSKGGTAYAAWCAMVAAGMAKRDLEEREVKAPQERFFFWLTREGAEAALKGNERLDPEDFPVAAISQE